MKGRVAEVSVVIPCYRCADTIARAVASVTSQSLKPAEVILVDDCSGDATSEILYRLQAQYPQGWIKVIEQSVNDGPGTARNAGWEAAQQSYIAFLDSDDSWHPRKIEIQYNWMKNHPEAALTGHACMLVSRSIQTDDQHLIDQNDPVFCEVSRNQLLLSNWFSTPSVMLKRELPQRFVRGKRRSEDYLLWLEVCLSGAPCFVCLLPLAYLYKGHYGEGGLSGDLWKMEKGELDTYQRIWKAGFLNSAQAVPLFGWSLLKHVHRLAITSWKIGR